MTVVTEDSGGRGGGQRRESFGYVLPSFVPAKQWFHAECIPLLKLVAPLGTFQMHILKSSLPEPQNVIALGERAFKEVTK